MERKLASIQQIKELRPIAGADLIELAIINSWQVVVKKGQHQVNELVVYCEIDSFLPIKPDYEFLRKSCLRQLNGKEGFRIKTIRLKGELSQGLILPLSILNDVIHPEVLKAPTVEDDVTEALEIVKYEKDIPAHLSGIVRGNFPSFFRKTDEERIQNLTRSYENFKRNTFYVTEKLDGSSASFYHNDGDFGVCSRNIDLLESEDNSFWKAARAMNLKEVLPTFGNIALQGELVGEGIQGNPYKLEGQKVFFFNAWNIDTQQYYELPAFLDIINKMCEAGVAVETVPIIATNFLLPATIESLLEFAESKSILNPKVEREGVVIRSYNKSISFKAISNKWLLKYED